MCCDYIADFEMSIGDTMTLGKQAERDRRMKKKYIFISLIGYPSALLISYPYTCVIVFPCLSWTSLENFFFFFTLVMHLFNG